MCPDSKFVCKLYLSRVIGGTPIVTKNKTRHKTQRGGGSEGGEERRGLLRSHPKKCVLNDVQSEERKKRELDY